MSLQFKQRKHIIYARVINNFDGRGVHADFVTSFSKRKTYEITSLVYSLGPIFGSMDRLHLHKLSFIVWLSYFVNGVASPVEVGVEVKVESNLRKDAV